MANISSDKKIAQNTLFLYFRMMFIMIVSLYTSRINLAVLGIDDNGIYQVVGGLVIAFSFLNGSLSGATSRFLTYEMGTDNNEQLGRTFSSAIIIHILLSFIILFLAETIGLWILNNKLVIPADRMKSAQIVYQFSILSCMLSIIQIPYTSLIIAHEKMTVFAYLGIIDVSLRLIVCYLLYILPFDKLIVFSALLTLVTILNFGFYYLYCTHKFIESKIKLIWDSKIVRPILSFSSWDLFGNFSVMARTQGVNIVLNTFYGPAINSAAGFAASIGNAVYAFSNNFMTAIRPPIVKAYAQCDYTKMQDLMIKASKYSFCLLALLSMPFFFESNYIVTLWLKTPPEYTGVFCALDLLLNVIATLFLPLVFAIHASGEIKFMSIVNGSIWFLSLPLTYIALRLGFSPAIPYLIKILLLFPVIVSNLYSVRRLIPGFNTRRYFKLAVLPSLLVFIITGVSTLLIHSVLPCDGFLKFIITCVGSTTVILISTMLFILNQQQRKIIISKIKQRATPK